MKQVFLFLLFLCGTLSYGQKDSLSLSYYNKSYSYSKKGDFNNALAFIDKALSIDSLNNNYIMQKALVLSSNKQYDEAITVLDKIEEIGKETENSIILKSLILEEKGEIEESLAVLIVFCEYQPSKRLYTQIALSFFKYNGYDEAINYYYKALNIDPSDETIRIDLASVLYSLGKEQNNKNKKDESLRLLQEGLKLKDSNILKFFIAQYYHEEKEYDRAIEILNNIIEKEAKAKYIKYRAEILQKDNKDYQSYNDYLKLLELDECNSEYYSKILSYLYKIKDYKKVVEYTELAIKCDEKNLKYFIEGLFTSYFFLGDDENGKKYLNIGLKETNLKNFNAYYIKALLSIKGNYYDEAIRFLNLSTEHTQNTNELIMAKLLESYIFILKKDFSNFAILYSDIKDFKKQETALYKIRLAKVNTEKTSVKFNFNKVTGEINVYLIVSDEDYNVIKSKYDIDLEFDD